MGQEELNEFLETHSTLINENPNFWNDFANGADITKYKTQELRKVYEGYEANLISVRSQMKFATEEQKTALRVQEQMILALMEYNGELDKGGDALKNYNTLFEQYQRLLKYGIDDLYLYNQAQENLWQYTISQLTLLDSLIEDQVESFDEGLGSIEDYIEMVNGVPILKTDALTDLDSDDLSIFWRLI